LWFIIGLWAYVPFPALFDRLWNTGEGWGGMASLLLLALVSVITAAFLAFRLLSYSLPKPTKTSLLTKVANMAMGLLAYPILMAALAYAV
jgi:hypothetical protein